MAYYLTMEREQSFIQSGTVIINDELVKLVNDWIDTRWIKDFRLTAVDLYNWAQDDVKDIKLQGVNTPRNSQWLDIVIYDALSALCPTIDVVWDKRLELETPTYNNFHSQMV